MKATEILEQEHHIIERVASACGVFVEMLQTGKKIPATVLQRLVDVLRVYGNQYLQEEDEWLFSMLRTKGVRGGTSPIPELRRENRQIASAIDQLAIAVDEYSAKGGIADEKLIDALRSLTMLYPEHFWKENYLLLPMAEKVLSDGDQQLLAETLRMIDEVKGPPARRTVERLSAAIQLCPECNPPEEYSVA